MTSEEIKQKLIENNLDSCIETFEANHLLDEDALSSMTNEDYISIGISIIGDRKKLLSLFSKTAINKSEPKIEVKVEPEKTYNQPEQQHIVIEKKSSGVWAFIGVLIAIILIIIIIAAL